MRGRPSVLFLGGLELSGKGAELPDKRLVGQADVSLPDDVPDRLLDLHPCKRKPGTSAMGSVRRIVRRVPGVGTASVIWGGGSLDIFSSQ